MEDPFGVEPAEGELQEPPRLRPRFRLHKPRWAKLPRPDLNEGLVLVGLPVSGVALWQLTPRAFWLGAAILGALAAGWGIFRASR